MTKKQMKKKITRDRKKKRRRKKASFFFVSTSKKYKGDGEFLSSRIENTPEFSFFLMDSFSFAFGRSEPFVVPFFFVRSSCRMVPFFVVFFVARKKNPMRRMRMRAVSRWRHAFHNRTLLNWAHVWFLGVFACAWNAYGKVNMHYFKCESLMRSGWNMKSHASNVHATRRRCTFSTYHTLRRPREKRTVRSRIKW
jgi:hypothetical protein